MKAGSFLDSLRQLPLCRPHEVIGTGPLLVLSPHPDDETLGTGGLIAGACARGQPVEVVILTDGAGSHPRSMLFPKERLVALRKAEAAEATRILGLPPERLHHLDLADTQAPSNGPAFDQAVDRLARLLRRTGASTVLVTWGRDPHCDHEAADAMARALRRAQPGLALWSYPIWGWHLDAATEVEEPPPVGFRLDIAPFLDRKLAAIAAHASQMTDLIPDDPDGFRFDPAKLEPFLRPVETFFAVPA